MCRSRNVVDFNYVWRWLGRGKVGEPEAGTGDLYRKLEVSDG